MSNRITLVSELNLRSLRIVLLMVGDVGVREFCNFFKFPKPQLLKFDEKSSVRIFMYLIVPT
jgi:hypothetical protein